MKGSVIPIVDFTTVCEGWMVFVLVGALIMFLAGLFFWVFIPKYGVDAGMVVHTILLYVVISCTFTTSLCCAFISLCGDAFVYRSAILTFVLGAPNLCSHNGAIT